MDGEGEGDSETPALSSGGDDVAAYGAIGGELAAGARPREEILAAHGLDEDLWQAMDDAWQAMISAAIEAADMGVPPILTAYAEAFARAQQKESKGEVISLEKYAEATRAIERSGGEVIAALKSVGISLPEFLRGNEHWAQRMVQDPALSERFAELLS